MKVSDNEPFFLTYCSNIHPGNGWKEVFDNLKKYGPSLKDKISPNKPFGIGLRISNTESLKLLRNNNLAEFRDFLDKNGLYVFTINGFPYGVFHKVPVKEDVYAPDWQKRQRVLYTLRLIKILSFLLPKGLEGSISTVPLSYRKWVKGEDKKTYQAMVDNILEVLEVLIRLKEKNDQLIHLDFEPEPDCLLANSTDVTLFFKNWLLKKGTQKFPKEIILEHIRICLDTCHMAVAFENPKKIYSRFNKLGIKIGKIQISSALEVNFPKNASRSKTKQALKPFADSVYLHQVTQKNLDGSLTKFPDLDQALNYIEDPKARKWRIHFHVPIFLSHLDKFVSTQNEIIKTIKLLKKTKFCNHLEIETYTWDVLPRKYQTNLLDSIYREYSWTLKQF